jgi:hypothetical protein
MEEYLTTDELSLRIKMVPGTIRNLVWKDVFQENIHYVKPTPRKILFIWSRIEAWLYGKEYNESNPCCDKESKTDSLINI